MSDDTLFGRYKNQLETASPVRIRGRVTEVVGTVVKAAAPDARIGDVVQIKKHDGAIRLAEVVGFKEQLAILMPLGSVEGIGPQAEIESTGEPFEIVAGEALLGRVLDGLGQPIDGKGDVVGERWAIMRDAPLPLDRPIIRDALSMGIRAIDGLLTIGEGQRVGLFAASGVGKSTLLGEIARSSEADVNVICLVGERGREVRDFIENVLGEKGMQKSVVVCATSDQPSLVRLKSAFVATAIAEWFRDQGKSVLLLMDSVTRFARAQREVGLAAGEPPARRGYPPSVFALLPRLLERTGTSPHGTITGVYTVLVEGGDLDEPIADEVRGILDGHIILSRKLAERNHWPAIDVLPSLSRVMNQIVSDEHREFAGRFRQALSAYESKRDLIALGAYQYGSDAPTDFAIDVIDEMETFLKQRAGEQTDFDTMLDRMGEIVR